MALLQGGQLSRTPPAPGLVADGQLALLLSADVRTSHRDATLTEPADRELPLQLGVLLAFQHLPNRHTQSGAVWGSESASAMTDAAPRRARYAYAAYSG
jgi:hypothetical protein